MMDASLCLPFLLAYHHDSLIEGGCVGISRHIVAVSSFLKARSLEIACIALNAGLGISMAYRWRSRFCRFLGRLVY